MGQPPHRWLWQWSVVWKPPQMRRCPSSVRRSLADEVVQVLEVLLPAVRIWHGVLRALRTLCLHQRLHALPDGDHRPSEVSGDRFDVHHPVSDKSPEIVIEPGQFTDQIPVIVRQPGQSG